MTSRISALGSIGILALVTACSSVAAESGLNGPFTVNGGQFFKGSWTSSPDGPQMGSSRVSSAVARPGDSSQSIVGAVEPRALGVAVRLRGHDNGFWVVPTGLPDGDQRGLLAWKAEMDFSRSMPTGPAIFEFAGVDENKVFGPSISSQITLSPDVTTDEKTSKVISLSWSNRADLDIRVTAPSGKVLNPKHKSTGTTPDGGVPPSGTLGVGTLDRDSNAGCAYDGHMRENVVFNGAPEPGVYQVRVGMFAACGEPSATFRIELWDGGNLSFSRDGVLTDRQADAGEKSGLFISEFSF